MLQIMPERTSEVKELLHWMEMYMGQAHEKFKALDSSRPRQIGSLNRLKARLIFLTGGYETFVDILDTLREMHETLRLLAPPAPECQEVAAQGHRVSVRPQNDSVGGAAGTVPGTHRELALGAYDGTDTVGFQSLQSQVGDVHPSTEEPDLAEDLTLTFAYLYSLTTETVDILASMTGSGPLSKAGARMHLWAANSVEVKPSIEQICGVKYLHESDLGQCLLTVLATALALGGR